MRSVPSAFLRTTTSVRKRHSASVCGPKVALTARTYCSAACEVGNVGALPK